MLSWCSKAVLTVSVGVLWNIFSHTYCVLERMFMLSYVYVYERISWFVSCFREILHSASAAGVFGMAELLLDPDIRIWVFLPIVVLTFLIGIVRHYLSILISSPKKIELQQMQDRWVIVKLWTGLHIYQIFMVVLFHITDPRYSHTVYGAGALCRSGRPHAVGCPKFKLLLIS